MNGVPLYGDQTRLYRRHSRLASHRVCGQGRITGVIRHNIRYNLIISRAHRARVYVFVLVTE